MVYKKTIGEKVFDVFNYLFLLLLLFVSIYPCWYVLVMSVSDPVKAYAAGGFILTPKGFSLSSYFEVVRHEQLWHGYLNTIFYVLVGGGLSVLFTITSAFALTRKGLPGRNTIMFLILFTMYFSGGLIPSYLLVKSLHMLDTPWAMIFPTLISTYNLIITISYFNGLPPSLEEAAKIDGANEYSILFKIMVPLSKPIIAVIALYYMVAIWNNYFSAMIYISDRKWYPLQLVLREILIQNNTSELSSASQTDAAQAYAENVKYATMVVSTIPVLMVYPFLQKFFVKGVMIGAVKG